MQADYAVLDLETTGGNRYTDDIIEVAIVLVDHKTLRITDTYHTLVKPRRMHNPAEWVNHINVFSLINAPTFDQIAPSIKTLLAGRILVGHNLKSFDLPFLNAAFERHNHTLLPKEASLDTLHLARKHLHLPHHRLGDLVRHYNLTNPQAHSALGDTIVTAQVLIELLREEQILLDADSRVKALCPPSTHLINLDPWLPRTLQGAYQTSHSSYLNPAAATLQQDH